MYLAPRLNPIKKPYNNIIQYLTIKIINTLSKIPRHQKTKPPIL